ncbi:hypothetical protein U1Q18_031402, partial [Sarracenia purpurea var. burkii]
AFALGYHCVRNALSYEIHARTRGRSIDDLDRIVELNQNLVASQQEELELMRAWRDSAREQAEWNLAHGWRNGFEAFRKITEKRWPSQYFGVIHRVPAEGEWIGPGAEGAPANNPQVPGGDIP